MTTSGVTSFSVSRNDIIYMAMEDLGVYAPGFETPTAGQITMANKRLNAMIKAWQAAGVGLWLNLLCTLPMKSGATSYLLGPTGDNCSASSGMGQTVVSAAASSGALVITVGSVVGMVSGQYIGVELDSGTIQWTTINGAPAGTTVTLAAALIGAASANNVVYFYAAKIARPIAIVEARSVNSSNVELPLRPVSRDEYMTLPLKSSTGPVVQYYYDAQTSNGTLFVWPVETDMASKILFTARTPVQDFVNAADTPDFPQEWFDALHFNLALRMAPAYKIDQKQYVLVKEQAAICLADADGFDREQGTSVRFVYDTVGW
jgi:hypothetical protein